jgi:hypothetical protein
MYLVALLPDRGRMLPFTRSFVRMYDLGARSNLVGEDEIPGPFLPRAPVGPKPALQMAGGLLLSATSVYVILLRSNV